MVVAANKSDLSKSKWDINPEEIQKFADSVGAQWFETSAKMGTGPKSSSSGLTFSGVNEMFAEIAKQLVEHNKTTTATIIPRDSDTCSACN